MTDFFIFIRNLLELCASQHNKTIYTMKKIISALAIGFLFISCELGDDDSSRLELLPVNSVDMPTAFAKDSITEIPVKYIRPTTCHFFNNFYYDSNVDFKRTVAIYTINLNQSGCQNDNTTLVEVPLKFKPTTLGTYNFRFWTGDNAQGISQYIEFDAIVDH